MLGLHTELSGRQTCCQTEEASSNYTPHTTKESAKCRKAIYIHRYLFLYNEKYIVPVYYS